MHKNKKIILAFILGSFLASSAIVSASSLYQAKDITYKDSNIEVALAKAEEKAEHTCPKGYECEAKKCIRATNLHTEVCPENGDRYAFCTHDEAKIGAGTTITYGNKNVTEGTLNVGDAFTCDVNGDGIYDEATERFYYLSPLYSGYAPDEGLFVNDEIAVLIYYSNVSQVDGNVIPDNKASVAYNLTKINNQGPVEAFKSLPNVTQWKNLDITNFKRQLYSDGMYYEGSNTRFDGDIKKTAGGSLGEFEYTNKAARMLRYQEIVDICLNNKNEQFYDNALNTDKCRFLLEGTSFSTPYGNDYWLETPELNDNISARLITGLGTIGTFMVDSATEGVRPVIEVNIKDIKY